MEGYIQDSLAAGHVRRSSSLGRAWCFLCQEKRWVTKTVHRLQWAEWYRDIQIVLKDLEAHQQHVHQVLQWLLENKLFVKAEKCELLASSVSFLGYIIAQRQLRVDPAKVRAVTEWPALSNLKQLQLKC